MREKSGRLVNSNTMQLKKLEPHPGCLLNSRKTLARAPGRVPREARNLTDGRQEGEAVTGRNPGKHLVPINQRPSNGGCWRVNSRSFTEKIHVGVQAVGESHRKATHKARQSFGGFVAHGVAIHLSVVGRGEISGPTIVTSLNVRNIALNLAMSCTKKGEGNTPLYALPYALCSRGTTQTSRLRAPELAR